MPLQYLYEFVFYRGTNAMSTFYSFIFLSCISYFIFLLQKIQKGIDDLRKTMDRLRQREKQIIKEAVQAEVKKRRKK